MDGGGVSWSGAHGTLINCFFNDNSAVAGGAIAWKGADGSLTN